MKPVDVAPALAAAATAVDEARWAEASALLLDAWRDCRTARIARAVAAIELKLPAPPPLDGKLVKTREAQWHELVAAGSDACLRRALAAPWPTHPKEARARVQALKPHVSARVSNALLAVHRSAQYTSVAGVRLSREIFQLLIGIDDHAVVEELERLEKQPYEAYRLGAAILRRRRPQAPYVSPEGAAALARIEERLALGTASTRDQLLAAIYEAPHDDGPRLVYADVLSEAGDPRGELITLQLQGGDPKRAEKLLARAGRSWFDGLDADGATKIVHRRGFPAEATLAAGEIRAPAWATIERLFLRNECEFRGALHLRALRELYDLGAKDLATAKLPNYELEVLTVRTFHDGHDVDTPFAPRVLGLARSTTQFLTVARKLRGTPIARRLETLRAGTGIRSLPEAIGLAADVPFAIELTGGFALDRQYQWAARITKTTLALHWAGTGPYGDVAFETVFPILDALPAPRIEELEVTGEAVGLDRVRDGLIRVVGSWPKLRSARILGFDSAVTN